MIFRIGLETGWRKAETQFANGGTAAILGWFKAIDVPARVMHLRTAPVGQRMNAPVRD